MRQMWQGLRVLTICILLLAALLASCLPGKADASDHGKILELDTGWQYRWGQSPVDAAGSPTWSTAPVYDPDWRDCKFPNWAPHDPNVPSKDLWQKVQLPPNPNASSILVMGVWKIGDFFLDGKPLYRFGGKDSSGHIAFPGSSWLIIPLPNSTESRMLAVHTASDDNFTGLYGGAFLGDERALILSLVNNGMPPWIFGVVYVFLGIFASLLFLHSSRDKTNLSFAGFVVAIGLYDLARSPIKLLVFDHPAVWDHIELISFYSIPFWICIFSERLFGAGPFKILRRIWQLDLVWLVFAFAFSVFNNSSLWRLLSVFQDLFLFAAVLMCAAAVQIALKKGTDARIFAFTFVCGVCTGIHDVLVSMSILTQHIFLNQYGIFAFVLGLVTIVSRRFVAALLVREGLELARTVQDLLLPKIRSGEFSPFAYSAMYQPFGEMSGDWLNYWDFSDDEKRLIFGDVVGKGPQAAIAVSAIAALINTCKNDRLSLGDTLVRINAELRELFGQEVATTFAAAVLNRDGSITLFNGGGIGWIRTSREGTQHVMPDGSLLGISDIPRFTSKTIHPIPGETVFSFTDGVLDGHRPLKKLVTRLKGRQKAHPSFDELSRLATECGRGVGDDDRTMVFVKKSEA